jgi:hypothetical protein
MGKRSDFQRKPRDFYPTPFAAVEPLIGHLPRKFKFSEPCAGDGQLCRHLEYMKMCSKIVSIGRIKWFGNMTGKDNCAWYLFENKETETIFYGR